jgi:hypothetical protein
MEYYERNKREGAQPVSSPPFHTMNVKPHLDFYRTKNMGEAEDENICTPTQEDDLNGEFMA